MQDHCRLCRRHAKLQRSHIISRFALRAAQDGDRQALERISNLEPPRLPLDQSWDVERLLCGGCEEHRRKWEAIVAATFVGTGDGRSPRPVLYSDHEYNERMSRFEGIQYGPVKLWVLSTLFLMHHAEKVDWTGFSLTTDEESRLRSRLLSGDPGSDLEFQVFGQITFRSSLTRDASGGIICPGYVTEGHYGRPQTRMGHFVALDCHWLVLLGDWPDNPLCEARLRTDGTWRVLRDDDYQTLTRRAQDLGLNL